MPTVRERKSSKNDDGEATCDAEAVMMEVIDVSDNEANETDVAAGQEQVDLTESGDNQDNSGTAHPPAENSEKENAFIGGEEKGEEEEMDLMLPKADEGRTRNDTDMDEQMNEADVDADSNNSDEGAGIAMTRAKRNSVRRPTRPGDFEFDYGDSTDFDEDEDGGDRPRPTRALLERQRNLRNASGPPEEGTPENERGRRSADMPGRPGRKRTSGASEALATQKRRRRNQVANEEPDETEEADPTFNSAHHSNNSNSSNNSNAGSNGRSSRGAPDGKASSAPSSGGGGDDSDLFCWVCHRYGKVICCETCVRVYHMRCLNLTSEPSDDWFCPECADSLLDSQPTFNFLHDDTRRAILTHEELAPLLLHATKQMFEVPASEPFHQPVDTSDVRDYENYIINPMSLSTLEENVKALKYSSVGSFMSDARWIVHNCIVYNGHANPLTAVSRQILKRCRMELREISACPDCYRYHMEADTKGPSADGVHWFAKLCRIAHPIVWVRLRNYPEWPAKVIEEVRHRDEYRVRTKFFGAHDYAEVPFSCVTFHTPIKAAVDPKTLQVEHFKEALDELQTHQRLLKEKYPDFVLPSVAVNYVPEIADNTYRRLGSRQTRVVCATLGDGSDCAGGGDGGIGEVAAVPGTGPSALVSSRRSSSESVSSSVFASGSNVHMYRAKPISDTKTRLVSVSVAIDAASPAGPDVKQQDSAGSSEVNGAVPVEMETVPEETSIADPDEPADGADGAEIDGDVAKGSSDRCQSPSSREGAFPPSEAEAEPEQEPQEESHQEQQEEPEPEQEPEQESETEQEPQPEPESDPQVEAPPPLPVRAPPECSDRTTSTEDLEDIFSALRSSSMNSLLQLPLIELLSGLRWGGHGSPRANSGVARTLRSSADVEQLASASEELARKEAECERLARENGELRRAMEALERLRSEASNKLGHDLSLTEERLAILHELRLLELRHNYELCLAEVRHANENDKQKVVTEVRRLLTEDVRKIVGEVKRKQWCAYCRNEAFYYCCWNTSYCDANCQKKHWTTHMSTCAQTNPSLSDGVGRRSVVAANAAGNNATNSSNNNINSNSIGSTGPTLTPQIMANRRMLNTANLATLPQR